MLTIVSLVLHKISRKRVAEKLEQTELLGLSFEKKLSNFFHFFLLQNGTKKASVTHFVEKFTGSVDKRTAGTLSVYSNKGYLTSHC